MNKRKKPIISKTNKSINKWTMFIIFFIVVILLGSIASYGIITNMNKDNYQSYYYKGSLYSINQAANLLDYVSNGEKNVVISPFNIYSNLAYIYNGVDNNSRNEIKNIFKKNEEKVNEEIKNKLNNIQNEKEKNEFNELYESLMMELENKGYSSYSLNSISSLNSSEKQDLQLLLKKISLTKDRLDNKNSVNKDIINEYKLSDKEVIENAYSLKGMLDGVLSAYDGYLLTNKVVNYTGIYTSNLDNKKIYKDFTDSVDFYGIKIDNTKYEKKIDLSNAINEQIKLVTDNKIKRIGEDKINLEDLVFVNTLYFDYAWENPFIYVDDYTFLNSNGRYSAVSLMFSEEEIYLENEYATGFIKNFKNGKYSFVGILPKTTDDFNLSDLDIERLVKNRIKKKVLIGLPKFEYQTEVDLSMLHENMGIGDIYTNKANFSKMTNERIMINKNIQKISITIGENGTRISNVNKDIMNTFTYGENVNNLIFNRSFAFVILDNDTNDVMIIGKVVNM